MNLSDQFLQKLFVGVVAGRLASVGYNQLLNIAGNSEDARKWAK